MQSTVDFNELLPEANRLVYGTVKAVLRGYEDFVDDVLQETALSAWKHFDQFEGRSAFQSWYTRIAINKALMLRRQRKALESKITFDHNRKESVAVNEDGEEWDIYSYTAGRFIDPERLVIIKEQRDLLINEINWLPKQHRKAILRHFWGPPGRNGTEKARRHRARKLLAEQICDVLDVEGKLTTLRVQMIHQHSCPVANRT
jgi:RNA polymerase sigma factor (sigma-70 family)